MNGCCTHRSNDVQTRADSFPINRRSLVVARVEPEMIAQRCTQSSDWNRHMTFKKTISAVVAAATLATGTLLPVATANARDYDRRGPGYSWQADRDRDRGYHRGYNRRDDRRYAKYRHYRRDKSGKYVAIGAAAAILGLAIAASANRHDPRGY